MWIQVLLQILKVISRDGAVAEASWDGLVLLLHLLVGIDVQVWLAALR